MDELSDTITFYKVLFSTTDNYLKNWKTKSIFIKMLTEKNISNSIIATIGPSCNTPQKLLELKNAGVGIFRVNMSHSSLDDLKKFTQIGIENDLKIGLDTEGAQIRTVLKGIDLLEIKKGDILEYMIIVLLIIYPRLLRFIQKVS